jgi:hypothetical protein
VKKVQTHGILTERGLLNRIYVITGNLDDISNQSENSPQKSLLRLARQITVVSVGSVWTATKLLHTHPHKITVFPEIKPMDYGKRVRFCNWFISQLRKLSEHYEVCLEN